MWTLSTAHKPRISPTIEGDEFVHLTTSEFVSSFTGYMLNNVVGPKHVVTHEYVGQLVERCCEQSMCSCFTCDEFMSKLSSSAQFLSHKWKENVFVDLTTREKKVLWTPRQRETQ